MMTGITVEIDDAKAALLRKKAEKFGILPDRFVIVSVVFLFRLEKYRWKKNSGSLTAKS